MNISTRLKLINLVLFQVGWFACVLGAAKGYPWTGIIGVGLIGAWHLSVSTRRTPEAKLLLIVGIAGFAFESLQRYFGMLSYPGGGTPEWLAPLWMAALWVNFATTLNLSLAWFKARRLFAAASALIAGPLAYYAGMRLGAIEFPSLAFAMLSIGIGWALLFPAALWLATYLNGFKQDLSIDIDWPKEPYRV